MTALYDAVGSALTKTNSYLKLLRGDGPSDVIVVILTDGMENASQEWTHGQVFDLIRTAEQTGWQFLFRGANQDSWAVSQRLGIQCGVVVDWAPDAASHKRAIHEANMASRACRVAKVQQKQYRDRRVK